MRLKPALAITATILFLSTSAFTGDTIYRSKNKIDFVKLDKAKKEEKKGGLKHPYAFEAGQVRAILGSIRFNKKGPLLKDIEDQPLFDDENADFLTPYLVEAFHKVGENQVVIVSYFTRDTKVVIQDDRLTIFRAFVKDDGLHLKFTKLYAKLLGDRTTKGLQRAMNEARGLGASINPQPGQNRISWDPEELVIGLKPTESKKSQKP